jgi:beta-lactamase superfamily II metal-dependent hydrolase
MSMKGTLTTAALIALVAVTGAPGKSAKTLDIYFIDVEGGQATLLVTPAGQSLLIDTGFPGAGTFLSKPGDPHEARDAGRIAAAARDAGLTRIDYLLITHFHADHDGGVVELAKLLPIRAFIDHDSVRAEAERNVPGTLAAFAAYVGVRAGGRHLEPKPGARLPLKGVSAVVVSSAGTILDQPLAGAGGGNSVCAPVAREAREPNENPRSTGIVFEFGKFRFLDVGDLTGPPLFALACPNDRIGPVDVYLVAHHGGADAADPATLAAFKPRVAIINNGPKKGGEAEMFASLRQARDLDDVWQLHRSEAAGGDNVSEERIANLDSGTAHWIKLSANADGSFRVMNGRTGVWKNYGVR